MTPRPIGRRSQPFRQAIAKPIRKGPEYNPWFWNPGRIGIKQAPADVRKKLKDIDPSLAIVWNQITERWQVFSRFPRMNHPICQGWRLLFVHHDGNGGYAPLDNRVFARLYESSLDRWGSAKAYFDAVQSQAERNQEQMKAKNLQETLDIATPHWEYSQIKNIGKGSKFSTYFA